MTISRRNLLTTAAGAAIASAVGVKPESILNTWIKESEVIFTKTIDPEMYRIVYQVSSCQWAATKLIPKRNWVDMTDIATMKIKEEPDAMPKMLGKGDTT